jgi:stage III sporulation protein AF
MSIIVEWITNIIIFILLAIVIDLLLPSTNLQKYVKMVIGLILILIMLTPILKIFTIDVDQLIASITSNESEAEKNVLENEIEQKKTEIQASQRAYILEQMAVHMKKDVAEELMNHYGLTIKEITFETNGEKNLRFPDDIQLIEVIVAQEEKEERNIVPTVKPIIIDTSEPSNHTDEREKLADDTASFLATKWGVNPEKIAVQVEGREQK